MFSKSKLRMILIILLTFQGVSGFFGGLFLIIDPSGELLNLPIKFLTGSPFTNYLIPGIILFSLLGIIPLIVLFGLWKYKNWANLASVAIGVILLIWILVEILMIGYQTEPPLQLIYGIVGILITAFALVNYLSYSNDKF